MSDAETTYQAPEHGPAFGGGRLRQLMHIIQLPMDGPARAYKPADQQTHLNPKNQVHNASALPPSNVDAPDPNSANQLLHQNAASPLLDAYNPTLDGGAPQPCELVHQTRIRTQPPKSPSRTIQVTGAQTLGDSNSPFPDADDLAPNNTDLSSSRHD